MNKKTLTIIALQAFIIIVLFWLLVFYGKDEYEESMSQDEQEENIETPSLVKPSANHSEGIATLVLSEEIQKNSAITSQPLKAASHHAGIESFGTVMNLTSFLELRNRYLTAKNEAASAQNAVSHSQQEYQRMLALNQDDKNISDKALANANLVLKTEQARLKATLDSTKLLRETIRQEWGEVLSDYVSSLSKNNELDALLQQKSVLIRVSFPHGTPSPIKGSMISISPVGAESQVITARYLSEAPQSDGTIQGITHFYTASSENLRAGMRVSVERDDHTKNKSGVLVPHQAVVWYANQAWIYQKNNANTFARRPVQTDIEIDGGWFSQGFKAGDLIVTSGAQLLLSEEFKSQITNENDD